MVPLHRGKAGWVYHACLSIRDVRYRRLRIHPEMWNIMQQKCQLRESHGSPMDGFVFVNRLFHEIEVWISGWTKCVLFVHYKPSWANFKRSLGVLACRHFMRAIREAGLMLLDASGEGLLTCSSNLTRKTWTKGYSWCYQNAPIFGNHHTKWCTAHLTPNAKSVVSRLHQTCRTKSIVRVPLMLDQTHRRQSMTKLIWTCGQNVWLLRKCPVLRIAALCTSPVCCSRPIGQLELGINKIAETVAQIWDRFSLISYMVENRSFLQQEMGVPEVKDISSQLEIFPRINYVPVMDSILQMFHHALWADCWCLNCMFQLFRRETRARSITLKRIQNDPPRLLKWNNLEGQIEPAFGSQFCAT